jgi:spore coat protein SA
VKICHVAPELLPVPPVRGGAIERWIRDAARLLAERGHDVHVVSRDHGDRKRAAYLDGVQYHFVRIPSWIDSGRTAAVLRGPWYFSAAGRLLSRLRPDIVHHHSRPSGLWLASLLAGRSRYVISLHSMQYGWNFGYAAWDRVLFRQAFKACARVLCVSDFVKQHTLDLYPDLGPKTMTLYNGVDGRTFHPHVGSEGDRQPQIVLYVGRIEERKGVHLLLEAFERVIARRVAGVRLRIVGPHSYWAAQPSSFYTSLANRCSKTTGVEFRGPTYDDAELAGVYRSATVSVVPSVFPEALGLTSIEAQASGVPVVVSNAGGLPETVLPDQSGLIFENGDVDGLASSVVSLLNDPSRLSAMRTCARAWAMKRFSWDHIASRLEDIYAEAIA